MEYSLLRNNRSFAFTCEIAGMRTSMVDFGIKPGKSIAAGVGNLLVSGVEYSLSVDTSKGVGADETDSLSMTDLRALPGPLLGGSGRLNSASAAAKGGPVKAASSAATDLCGLLRGRLVAEAPVA